MGLEVTVTKRFKFSAAHHLPNDPGPCRRIHGHTFEVDVTAAGPVGASGMVVHFDELKRAWAELEPLLDHQDLNDTLPLVPPTTENLAGWLLDELHGLQPLVRRVTVYEGPGSSATAELT